MQSTEKKRISSKTFDRVKGFSLIFFVIVLLPIFFLLTVPYSYSAQDCFTVRELTPVDENAPEASDPMPVIKVTFDKPAVDVRYGLYDSKLNKVSVVMGRVSDGIIYNFSPQQQLAEGLYKFTIQGVDALGNCGEYKEQSFRIRVQPIGIKLLAPKYGASSAKNINLLIETSRNSELCKYYSGERLNFEDILRPENIFAKTGSRQHSKDALELRPEGMLMKIVCNDSYGYINNDVPREFFLIYDPTSPSIRSFSSSPSQVVEGNNVTLQIATDDETVCRYDNESRPFDKMIFAFQSAQSDSPESAQSASGAASEYRFSNFTRYDEAVIFLNSDYTGEYKFYASCMNRAELTSMVSETKFIVNWNAADAIIETFPSGVVSKPDVTIGVVTNRKARCLIGNARLQTDDRFRHSMSSFLDAEGAKSFEAICQFDMTGKTVSKSFSFVYDTTPPVIISINNTNPVSGDAHYTCTDTMVGTWNFNETLSQIVEYNYTIIYSETGEEIIPYQTTTESKAQITKATKETNLSLVEGKSYGFKVLAKNSAGLWSSWLIPDGYESVQASSRYCGLSNCSDGTRNGNETDVDCGGTCATKCGLNQECMVNSDCDPDVSGICEQADTQYNYGNNYGNNYENNGIQTKRCARPYCSNGRLDAGVLFSAQGSMGSVLNPLLTYESDVDCGGKCEKKCGETQKCNVNSDCASLHCVNDQCAAPSCFDGIKNGQETDVDCGGECRACASPSCAAGNICVANCIPMDQDCAVNELASCGYGDGCKLNCLPRDPDCSAFSPSCGKDDGCVADCPDGPDPDCGYRDDSNVYPNICSAGNACAVNCVERDPDCPSQVYPTCNKGDGCKQGCGQGEKADPDCDKLDCTAGNVCVSDCEKSGAAADPDCKNPVTLIIATCDPDDGCAIGCVFPDADCNYNATAACGKNDGCKFNCPSHDPDCSGKVSCKQGDGCAAGCFPPDPDCGSYFTCKAGDGCMLGCSVPDSDCNKVVEPSCDRKDGCNPNCALQAAATVNATVDPDCGGFTCSAGDACVLNCIFPDPDCKSPSCKLNSDCASGVCKNGKCIDPKCEDQILNGDESDVDCGGSCGPCKKLQTKCLVDIDCSSDFCNAGICDDFNMKDSDKDGLPDYWENKYFCSEPALSSFGSDGVCAKSSDDADGDKLSNIEEFKEGTDPKNKDTDGDGASDWKEINNKPRTDPLDANDKPSNPLVMIALIVAGLAAVGAAGYAVVKLSKKKPVQSIPVPQYRAPPQIPAVKGITAEQLRQMQLHQKFISSMKEKQRKRMSAFSAFDEEGKTVDAVKAAKSVGDSSGSSSNAGVGGSARNSGSAEIGGSARGNVRDLEAPKDGEWKELCEKEPKKAQSKGDSSAHKPIDKSAEKSGESKKNIFDLLSGIGKKSGPKLKGDFAKLEDATKTKRNPGLMRIEIESKPKKKDVFGELDKIKSRKKG